MNDLTSLLGTPTVNEAWAVVMIFYSSVFFISIFRLLPVARQVVFPASDCGFMKGEPDHRQSGDR